MSGVRRFLPLLAVASALAVVTVTAVLTPDAATAPAGSSPAGADRAVTRATPVLTAQLAAEKKAVSALAATASVAAAERAAAAAQAAAYQNSDGVEAAALRSRGVPCDARAAACVSLSRQEAWLMRGGKVVYGPVPVATGRASLPTPAGDFRVWYKVVNGWSTTYDAPMPYSVFFHEGDAFHADPVTVRSHGCIHLYLSDAKRFYSFLHYGDLVEVRH